MDAKVTSEQCEVAGYTAADATRKALPRGVEKDDASRDKHGGATEENELGKLKYPEPWKYEKFFLGGYSQKRILRFRNPKSMYYAINLFAGQLQSHISGPIEVKAADLVSLQVSP